MPVDLHFWLIASICRGTRLSCESVVPANALPPSRCCARLPDEHLGVHLSWSANFESFGIWTADRCNWQLIVGVGAGVGIGIGDIVLQLQVVFLS